MAQSAGPRPMFGAEKCRNAIRGVLHEVWRPSAVYRLQLSKKFGFRQARALVPYLAASGIDGVYASPFFESVSGSNHGYDLVNPARLDPERGGEKAFERFARRIIDYRMGLLADIVPNHMGVTKSANPWWVDVLENGRDSLFADYFDIDWDPEKPELWGRVLWPVLGELYGKALESGAIRIEFDSVTGDFAVRCYNDRLPL
ncbi:MAG: hypothetical protein HQL11_01405, partial [Candidatus Omnitrophica bacterium]|nr:hypothetical protein [Candidatus Omnitrophota bacterium]